MIKVEIHKTHWLIDVDGWFNEVDAERCKLAVIDGLLKLSPQILEKALEEYVHAYQGGDDIFEYFIENKNSGMRQAFNLVGEICDEAERLALMRYRRKPSSGHNVFAYPALPDYLKGFSV